MTARAAMAARITVVRDATRAKRELPLVIAKMLGREVVELREGHVLGEERIPACRVVHAAAQSRAGFAPQAALQHPDHMIKHHRHPGCWDDPRTRAGSQVVDQVERCVRSVKHAREHKTRRTGQPVKDLHQDQQRPDYQVAEKHMEQQLLIGPPGAVGLPSQARAVRPGQQLAEVPPGLLHLRSHGSPVLVSGHRRLRTPARASSTAWPLIGSIATYQAGAYGRYAGTREDGLPISAPRLAS